jgi:integrase
MQRGTIIRQRDTWCVRFYEDIIKNGRVSRKKSFKVLAKVSKDYPTKTSVASLADKILEPINTGRQVPESSMKLTDFIENHYFPYARKALRPSTVKGYDKDIYQLRLRSRLGDVRLRDFRTVHGQRLIATIPNVGHKTLLRVKSFLSGVITYALREGVLDGHNPMHAVKAPGRTKKFKGPVYSMEELENIAEAVDDPTAFAVISTAAFAGLRLSELRGLRWEDFDGDSLSVSRSVWRTHVGDTKTEESEASVPVLPVLAKVLNNYRVKVNGQGQDYMFAGVRRGAPLNLHNLANRVIKPAMKSRGLEWRGWHAFRRGLASNLYDMNVKPKIIQAILRHSDIGTTLAYYVETPNEESRAALAKFEAWFKE